MATHIANEFPRCLGKIGIHGERIPGDDFIRVSLLEVGLTAEGFDDFRDHVPRINVLVGDVTARRGVVRGERMMQEDDHAMPCRHSLL